MSIPELSINPLAGRLSYFFESINFRDFVRLLAPFSPKASEDDKLRLMFDVLDVDGDGALSAEDLEQMLHYMAGSSLDNEQLQEIIAQVMKDVGAAPRGITFAQYRGALKARTGDLNVSIPVDA
ncbi:hypothetical protein H632_c2924p0 [Helicosporidium sp. ATCC 50920]|nr:hypothetical protein H632_c2924p0 [Helicosporidium sp. ATCC 50920]|eukprot:KDD72766.1 hypothetical protein H632_c2924p0 [Helicosporidium sp. ATCC 50920]